MTSRDVANLFFVTILKESSYILTGSLASLAGRADLLPDRDLDEVLAEIDAGLLYDVRRRTHHYQRYRRPELYGPLTDPTFGAKWLA